MADTNARLNEQLAQERLAQERLGRLIFRAWRRGFREADLVLGPFAEQIGPSLDATELDAFESLIEAEDHDLYAWIIGKVPVPAEHDGPLMARLQTFMRDHVAAVVAEGAG